MRPATGPMPRDTDSETQVVTGSMDGILHQVAALMWQSMFGLATTPAGPTDEGRVREPHAVSDQTDTIPAYAY